MADHAPPAPEAARACVVIPVYGRADLASRASASARDADLDVTILLIDDASPDDTANRLREACPFAEVIKRAANGGFAAAVNTGLDHPAAREAEFVALLNADAEGRPGWLARCVDALRADERLGSVSPLVVESGGDDRVDSAGQGVTVGGWGYRRLHGRPAGDATDAPIVGPTGCAAVFRRSALDAVGPALRQDLVCYYEDTELALRLAGAGYASRLVAGAVVEHEGSAIYGKMPGAKARRVSRNMSLVALEHTPRELLVRAFAWHLVLCGLHFLESLRRGTAIAWVSGKVDALRAVPTALRHRRGRRFAPRDAFDPDVLGAVRRRRGATSNGRRRPA